MGSCEAVADTDRNEDAMNESTHAASPPYATETVWDGGLSGTASSADGQLLTVGYEGGCWPPEQLLLLAAESSFMDSFLAAAREVNLEVLGYVSSGHLEPDDLHGTPRITVRPCVVVGSADDAARAQRICTGALQQSVVCRLLGDQF